MLLRPVVIVGFLLAASAVAAQQSAPSAASLAEAAARRFPQPVRVGDLLHRQVLQPLESQPTLGWVRNVVKQPDGSLAVVIDYGGFYGLFSRPIAVPVDGMALFGRYMDIVGFTPDQLRQFKTFDPIGTTALSPDSSIQVGLARPSH